MAPTITHTVTNQTPPISGNNAFRLNPLLLQIASGLDADILKDFDQIGRYTLSAEAQDLAQMANQNVPQLKIYDRYGHRVDQVEFHPSYHALMRRSVSYGLSSSVWEDAARGNQDGHFKRAIRYFMMAGLETGHLSSLSSTNGAVAALMTTPTLAKEWVPRVTSRKYDSAHKSPVEKNCLTMGYGIAEKHAGTDIAAVSTRAEAIKNGLYRIIGHKWFLASPMADAFLVLARSEKGVSCFLVPRFLADDEPNNIQLMGLKDKLGNRSGATAEVEFEGSIAQMVGTEGEGASAINELLTLTRLDAALASSGIMHASLAEAVHHARHRKAFGKQLIDQPMMTRVLADMAIDVAGCTALSMRLSRAFDGARTDEADRNFAHIMTPVVKFWTGKLAMPLIAEAVEVLGGNGCVETSVLPRHYRESPHLNTVEGTGNMMALELRKTLNRSPDSFEKLLSQLGQDLGSDGAQTVEVLRAAFQLAKSDEGSARIATWQLALAAAAAELKRLGTGTLADAFVETRLTSAGHSCYGMIDSRHDASTILDALYPPIS
ncbi:MAG: acyl-CoA dehydrogenase family protein [Pseudomonadota bacterium]